ncbi:DUF2061 domain-containing protein [Thalassotalea euphylliae]|uniref:DUF2061 domain-containing protein n=1 Tax=Thalassotalea euphylliae TaxID=1655234 RepID=A0A3E0TW94_9GAMM|nr:DUF2061 domain-containing protein [Thalassotalea euphylliae]REL28637.1 DUF2061 domain-containing protein [Thalassotalea euphylliae]
MAKTTTFAITHFSVAFGVIYAITGDFVLGGLVAIVEPAINTVAYFFHEKIWDKAKASSAAQLPSSQLNTAQAAS